MANISPGIGQTAWLARRIAALHVSLRGHGSTHRLGDLHKSPMGLHVQTRRAWIHAMCSAYFKRQKATNKADIPSLPPHLSQALETEPRGGRPYCNPRQALSAGGLSPEVMDTKVRAMMRRPRLGRRADVSRLSLRFSS
jgi:hypothetical protein